MIRRPTVTVAVLTLASLAAGGCESEMHMENLALHRQNRELQDKLDGANAMLRESPDPAQYKTLQAELLERDKQITDLRNQPVPAAATLPPTVVTTEKAGGPAPSPFGDLETSVDARAGTVTVSLPGDVLFAAGQAELRASAKASLDKVVSALKKSYPGRPIRVEGHTDSDPIVKSHNVWDDNLDLSLSRAAAVSRYLESHGVDPKKVTTSGYGAFHPRGASKSRNRRVEIVVVMR